MFTYLATDGSPHPAFALVSTDAVLLVLPPGGTGVSESVVTRLHELWQALRTSNAVDLLSHLHSLPGLGFDDFALLTISDDSNIQPVDRLVSLAVGGRGQAFIDDIAAFRSPGRVAITQARYGDCPRIELSFATAYDGKGGDELAVIDGVVRCHGVVFHADSAQPARGRSWPIPVFEKSGLADPLPRDATSSPAPHAAATTAPAPAFATTSAPATALIAAPVPAPSSEFVAAPDQAPATPLSTQAPASGASEPTGTAAAAREDQVTNQFDHLFEHTQFFDVEGAAVRSTDEATEADHGAPNAAEPVGGGPDSAVAPRRATHAPINAAQSVSKHTPQQAVSLAVTLPDGSSCPIDKPVLIGRRPTLSADADVSDYRLIKLDDMGGGLSRMHVRLDPHKGGVMITDLGSTNGSMLISANSSIIELAPHTPHLARAGDQLRLGNAIRLVFADA